MPVANLTDLPSELMNRSALSTIHSHYALLFPTVSHCHHVSLLHNNKYIYTSEFEKDIGVIGLLNDDIRMPIGPRVYVELPAFIKDSAAHPLSWDDWSAFWE